MNAVMPPSATTGLDWRNADYFTPTGFNSDFNNQAIAGILAVEWLMCFPESRTAERLYKFCDLIDRFIPYDQWFAQYRKDPTHPLHNFMPDRQPNGQFVQTYNLNMETLKRVSKQLRAIVKSIWEGENGPIQIEIMDTLRGMHEYLEILQLIVNDPVMVSTVKERTQALTNGQIGK